MQRTDAVVRQQEARHRSRVPDLSGDWAVTSDVSTSTFNSYVGLKVFYEVGFSQTGNLLQLAGEKDGEQKPAPVRMIYEGKARTTINGTGSSTIGDDGKALIRISAEEQSSRRNDIEATFVLTKAKDGSLQGSFKSEAASTTGTCVWRRQP